eukprot:5638367-Amphidinium_carterae.1
MHSVWSAKSTERRVPYLAKCFCKSSHELNPSLLMRRAMKIHFSSSPASCVRWLRNVSCHASQVWA